MVNNFYLETKFPSEKIKYIKQFYNKCSMDQLDELKLIDTEFYFIIESIGMLKEDEITESIQLPFISYEEAQPQVSIEKME